MLKHSPEPYQRFVRPYYTEKDPAHNIRHIERIFSRLDGLSIGLPRPKVPLLYFIASFHGLEKKMRADAAFKDAAVLFLENLGWLPFEIEAAFQSLARHLTNPQSVEEMIVHDANFVELLGAFGIAKAFTVGGAKGQSFEETVEVFEHYLNSVEFYTPMGKSLADNHTVYTRNFLQRLKSEW